MVLRIRGAGAEQLRIARLWSASEGPIYPRITPPGCAAAKKSTDSVSESTHLEGLRGWKEMRTWS